MVAAFDYCLHGKGGAAPSIDTAMHGLVDAAHVDHLHPDSGIALACAADGEKLTAECFGDTVVWVPWRRPGFQLGLDIAAVKAAHPEAVGCVLGGTGSPPGVTPPRSASGTRCTSSAPPNGSSPSGPARAVRTGGRGVRGAAGGRAAGAGGGSRAVCAGHRLAGPAAGGALRRLRRRPGLPGAGRASAARGAGHLLSGPLPAHQGAAAGAGSAAVRTARRGGDPAGGAARGLPAGVRRLLRAARGAGLPAMRGADPAIVLVPGVGMFSFGKDKQTARVAASSTSTRST